MNAPDRSEWINQSAWAEQQQARCDAERERAVREARQEAHWLGVFKGALVGGVLGAAWPWVWQWAAGWLP